MLSKKTLKGATHNLGVLLRLPWCLLHYSSTSADFPVWIYVRVYSTNSAGSLNRLSCGPGEGKQHQHKKGRGWWSWASSQPTWQLGFTRESAAAPWWPPPAPSTSVYTLYVHPCPTWGLARRLNLLLPLRLPSRSDYPLMARPPLSLYGRTCTGGKELTTVMGQVAAGEGEGHIDVVIIWGSWGRAEVSRGEGVRNKRSGKQRPLCLQTSTPQVPFPNLRTFQNPSQLQSFWSLLFLEDVGHDTVSSRLHGPFGWKPKP